MSSIPLISPESHWSCPNCEQTAVTHEPRPHTEFHACAGLKGLTAPMVPAGTRCKVEAHEREDYIGGGQLVTVDGDGRPVMRVEVTRDEGNDVVVFAPCAISDGKVG